MVPKDFIDLVARMSLMIQLSVAMLKSFAGRLKMAAQARWRSCDRRKKKDGLQKRS